MAKELGDIEIVTADSMQVYRGMDIGTAKPSLAERSGVAHHLIDVADPSQDWDVAHFVGEAQQVLREVASRGKRALFVGGTGLYVHALIDGFAVPGRWPEVAAELEETATSELFRRLELLDPVAAARVDPGNRRRALRPWKWPSEVAVRFPVTARVWLLSPLRPGAWPACGSPVR